MRNNKIRKILRLKVREFGLTLGENDYGLSLCYKNSVGGQYLTSHIDCTTSQPSVMLDFIYKNETYLREKFLKRQEFYDYNEELNIWNTKVLGS